MSDESIPESTALPSASESVATPSPEAAASSEAVVSSDATHASAEAAEASDQGGEHAADDASDAGDDAAEGDEATAGAAGAEADPTKKKKRRRKKKKGGAEAAGEGGAPSKPKKDTGHQPFTRFFEGTQSSRRHMFNTGEVVAGRVVRVEYGAIVVDLFGRAFAVVDDREPREIPVQLEAAKDEAAAEAGAADDSNTTATTPGAELAASEHEAAHVAAENEAIEAAAAEAQGTGEEEVSSAPVIEEFEGEGPAAPAVGSIFRGRIGAISESGHIALVNRNIEVKKAKAQIALARDAKRRVQGLIYGFNRGGFDVLVQGIRVFAPVSAMSLDPIEEPQEYLGQRLEFTVPPVKPGSHGIVVSRRTFLEKERRKRSRDFLRTLTPGSRIRGHVSHIKDFGIFVDLGSGVEGLVHISELSWDRSVTPETAAKPGDEIEVQVLKVQEAQNRREVERVSLSIKATQGDPWDAYTKEMKEGSARKGKVTRTAEFGAFIELFPGIEGLLHVSELGKDLKHAGQAIKEGDEVDVVLERVDRKGRRISLSRLSPQEAEELAAAEASGGDKPQPIRPGAMIKVKVEKVEAFGVIVHVVGILGRRGRGFMPANETATERGADLRKKFPPGMEMDVKVVGQDREGGIKVSRKAFINDEERRAVHDYRKEAAKQGLGTFADLLRQKLGG